MRLSKDKFRSLFAAVRNGLHRHRFYIVTAGVTLAVAGPSLMVARAAQVRTQAVAATTERLALALRLSDVWLVSFEADAGEESESWAASARAIEARGVLSSERVSVAQAVTERAEAAGIRELRLRFEDAPAELAEAPGCAPDWPLAPLPTALAAELVGDFAAVAAFLDDLPPTAEARQVELERTGEQVRARMLLIMYGRPEGGTANVS